MKYQEDYIQLSDRISWKNGALVSNILNKNLDLDLTYNEGEFFTLAIESNSVEIIKTLLDYFNNNQLEKYPSGSTEYLLLKNKIIDILDIAIEDVDLSEEMKQVLSPYMRIEDNENEGSSKSVCQEEDVQNHSGESTQVTLEDEHSLLSESGLAQYTTEHARDIKDLPVYQAIKSLQAVYSKSNDELAINIARDFGIHAGDVNSSHVRVWHKGIQKVIDIYSSISAEVKGVHLSLNSIIKDIITSPDAINCNLDGHEQHINLSGCEYEYLGEDI